MKRKSILIGFLALYGLLLFVLLTLARMPIERLISGNVQEATRGRVALRVEDLALRLPDRVLMRDVRFRVGAGKADFGGRMDAVQVRPDYSGLFRGYLSVRFHGETPAGDLRGRVGISPGSGIRDAHARLRTEAFALERFPAIRAFLDRDVEGRLTTEVSFAGNLENLVHARGEGTVRIDKGTMEARIGMPGLDRIPFDSLVMSFTLENGTLNLSGAGMKGPAFSGDFQGDIALREPLSRSRLRLQGDLKPGPLVLENAFLSRFLEKVLEGDRSVRVKVGGTLEAPTVARIKG